MSIHIKLPHTNKIKWRPEWFIIFCFENTLSLNGYGNSRQLNTSFSNTLIRLVVHIQKDVTKDQKQQPPKCCCPLPFNASLWLPAKDELQKERLPLRPWCFNASWHDVGLNSDKQHGPSGRIMLFFRDMINFHSLPAIIFTSNSYTLFSLIPLWYQIIYRTVYRSFTMETPNSKLASYPVLFIRPSKISSHLSSNWHPRFPRLSMKKRYMLNKMWYEAMFQSCVYQQAYWKHSMWFH